MMLSDEQYMHRCLELAAGAEGRTSPNPLVGALVVADDGTIIAEGFHEQAGQAHAEVIALDRAGQKAQGQTLFVNLEPCCHFGKTPPCSDRVIKSGVKRVVFGTLDPNPKVQGGGLRAIKEAGIDARFDVMVSQCRHLNRGFLKWIEHGRPWVCLKLAATIDGRIADRFGTSKWISGEEARKFVHELRNKYDCVLIGVGTAIQDDPQLNVRDLPGARNPRRAIVDARLQSSPKSKLISSNDGLTILFASSSGIKQKGGAFSTAKLIETPETSDQRLDLRWVLQSLGQQGIRTVLCEGGARLAGALLENDLVDELVWIVAPKLLIDNQSVAAVAAPKAVPLAQAKQLLSSEIKTLGSDFLIQGLLHQP